MEDNENYALYQGAAFFARRTLDKLREYEYSSARYSTTTCNSGLAFCAQASERLTAPSAVVPAIRRPAGSPARRRSRLVQEKAGDRQWKTPKHLGAQQLGRISF